MCNICNIQYCRFSYGIRNCGQVYPFERCQILSDNPDKEYRLDDQIGYILRRAHQRHTVIFAGLMPETLTPTRFAVMAKLFETGTLSQNELGRQTSMDIATIKGVVDRLRDRELIKSDRDPNDARRQLISLTEKGRLLIKEILPSAVKVTDETVIRLTRSERITLNKLLRKIC